MRIRRESVSIDLAPEMVELLLGDPAFQESAGVDAGGGMALKVDRIAGKPVALSAKEVVETNVV